MSALDKYDDTWIVGDHPVAFDDYVFPGGRPADAALVQKTSWVSRYLGEFLKESHLCLRAGAELAPAIASLASIDYIAGYFAGRRTNRHDYIGFVRQFYPSIYSPFAEHIYYELRCGLLHNLVLRNPWRASTVSFKTMRDSPLHLTEQDGYIIWSVRSVLEHTLRAWAMLAHHLIMDAPENAEAIAKFNARFDQHGGAAALMVQSEP